MSLQSHDEAAVWTGLAARAALVDVIDGPFSSIGALYET